MKYIALVIPYNGTYRIHCIWLDINNNRKDMEQFSSYIVGRKVIEVEELSDIRPQIETLMEGLK